VGDFQVNILKFRMMRSHALSSPYAFSKWVSTKDEHDALNPVKRFPWWLPYVPHVFQALLDYDINFFPKSRQLKMTWIMCIFSLWLAKRFTHRLIYAQSKNETDAAALVFNGGKSKNWDTARISFIESHLPDWLQDSPEPSSAPSRLLFPNGSIIQAIPQGGDMVRSKVPSFVFSDEAAFQPEFADAYTAMLPICKQGGKLAAVSSANPGFFGMVAA
jgi:hypothetical protein